VNPHADSGSTPTSSRSTTSKSPGSAPFTPIGGFVLWPTRTLAALCRVPSAMRA
jgi:hypothetical protein